MSDFSPTMVGIWDSETKDFVKNPSGRRKLFHRSDTAHKAADALNKEESDTAVARVDAAFKKLEVIEESYRKHFGPIPPLASRM